MTTGAYIENIGLVICLQNDGLTIRIVKPDIDAHLLEHIENTKEGLCARVEGFILYQNGNLRFHVVTSQMIDILNIGQNIVIQEQL